VLAGFEHGQHVGVRQPSHRLRLSDEPRPSGRVTIMPGFGMQQLDRNLAFEPRVVGREHSAHAPFTQLAQHRKAADLRGLRVTPEQGPKRAVADQLSLDAARLDLWIVFHGLRAVAHDPIGSGLWQRRSWRWAEAPAQRSHDRRRSEVLYTSPGTLGPVREPCRSTP